MKRPIRPPVTSPLQRETFRKNGSRPGPKDCAIYANKSLARAIPRKQHRRGRTYMQKRTAEWKDRQNRKIDPVLTFSLDAVSGGCNVEHQRLRKTVVLVRSSTMRLLCDVACYERLTVPLVDLHTKTLPCCSAVDVASLC
jgi:hypothetical protein